MKTGKKAKPMYERMNKKMLSSMAAVIASSALTFGLVACGDDAGSDVSAPPAASEVGVEISGAWARTSPMEVTLGAAYMAITSGVDDELTDVSVDPSIAATAEIHEMVMAEMSDTTMTMSSDSTMTMSSDSTMTMSDMSSDTTMPMGSGEMVMQEVESIAIPAGETVELKPGGYHIMLIDLAAPLETGQEFDIVLTFANAGEVTVAVVVGDTAP
jgi:copper(I)-binding protein